MLAGRWFGANELMRRSSSSTGLSTRSGSLVFNYVTIKDRVVPASKRGDLLDFSWPPSVRLVFKDRCSGPQHRVNDPPGFLHVIFTGKKSGVSRHRVSKHPFVGVHLFGARTVSPRDFHGLVQCFIVHGYAVHADGECDVRTDPQPAMILFQIKAFIHSGWLTQSDNNFSAGHRQTLPGAELVGHSAPTAGIDLQPEGR